MTTPLTAEIHPTDRAGTGRPTSKRNLPFMLYIRGAARRVHIGASLRYFEWHAFTCDRSAGRSPCNDRHVKPPHSSLRDHAQSARVRNLDSRWREACRLTASSSFPPDRREHSSLTVGQICTKGLERLQVVQWPSISD
jgi:hypothetical protein